MGSATLMKLPRGLIRSWRIPTAMGSRMGSMHSHWTRRVGCRQVQIPTTTLRRRSSWTNRLMQSQSRNPLAFEPYEICNQPEYEAKHHAPRWSTGTTKRSVSALSSNNEPLTVAGTAASFPDTTAGYHLDSGRDPALAAVFQSAICRGRFRAGEASGSSDASGREAGRCNSQPGGRESDRAEGRAPSRHGKIFDNAGR